MIANADKVGGKIGENLRETVPRLPLNRELTTIKTDVALDHAPDALVLRERHLDELRVLYQRYGFSQALKELDGGAPPCAVAGKNRARRAARLWRGSRAGRPCPALSAPATTKV